MDRRALIGGIVAAAALVPLTVAAQALVKAQRIGLLMATTPMAAAHIVVAFPDGLRERGHIEGQNIVCDYRWAEGRPERFAEMAADLVRHHVDVIVASSQAAALAARRATTTIPIVMVNAADPVKAALVVSLARPGGNITGLSQQLTPRYAPSSYSSKQALPRASRVAVLRTLATTVGLGEYEAAGRTLQVRVQVVGVRSRDDLAPAFAAMARDGIDALVVPADPLLFTERQRIAELARASRLPGMYSTREFAEAGGLMAYSAPLTEQFRHAALYVDKILRGASPATLPVESPSQYQLALNLTTAKALGLTIPQSLLLRADQVIE